MQEWYSERFQGLVQLSNHATMRMIERQITINMVGELIESGEIKNKDGKRMWIYKTFDNRRDNLICAAVVLDGKLIVKTLMHNWQLMEELA